MLDYRLVLGYGLIIIIIIYIIFVSKCLRKTISRTEMIDHSFER